MTKTDKITSLQKYVQTMKGQLTNIPERRQSQKEAYLAWVSREIVVATKKIESLRGV